MAISLSNLFQIRKFSLILPVSAFFLCLLLFIFFDSPLSYFSSTSSLLRQQAQFPPISSPPLPPPPSLSRSAPNLTSSAQSVPKLTSPVSVAPNLTTTPVPAASTSDPLEEDGDDRDGDGSDEFEDLAKFKWEVCKEFKWADYIPYLDNLKAIKTLKSRRYMEHRERHCPLPSPRCLITLPHGYTIPIPWPGSRDMIWYSNVPHPKLVEYKKAQNWVVKNGDYLQFPGGGTQFKQGVSSYIEFIEKVVGL